jgi:hypothetical protein
MFLGVYRGVLHGVWCSPVSVSIDTQASLELGAAVVAVVAAVARNGAKFSQYYVVWGGFPWGMGSGC